MTPEDTTLVELIAAYRQVRPAAIPTIRTILRTIAFPFWGHARLQPGDLDPMLAATPAHALYGLLAAGGRCWHPDVARRLPGTTSHRKAYCRFIRRLIAFGEDAGLLHPDQHAISPAWRKVLAALEPLVASEPPARRSALRSDFRRLCRWATTNGVLPEDVPVRSADGAIMAHFKATFAPDRDGGFYRARRAWSMVTASGHGMRLRPWGPTPSLKVAAIPAASWPEVLGRGLDALFSREGLGSWRPETQAGYAYRIGSYLGLLAAAGIEVEAVLRPLADGVDALRVLFQGMPPGFAAHDAATFAERCTRDAPYREDVLARMRALAGCYDGRASEGNPLLLLAVASFVEAGKITSARNLLAKAQAINRGLLGVTDRHTEWLARRIALLAQLARKSPSAYARKKLALFRSPRLWADLVRARARLREHTLALEAAWRGVGGRGSRHAQRRWAIALRDEVLFGLLLCYPLRVNNVIAMTIGANYLPATHRIFFPAEETKNGREIDYELPEGGALGDLRDLVEQYLAEARPALLAGRRSKHFFIPDPRGGEHLRAKGVNAIVGELSRRFLLDILPEGVAELNPHLLRHAAASYHLVVGRDLNLAAQLLNDSPTTVSRAYADVLACKREETKRFLSGFEL